MSMKVVLVAAASVMAVSPALAMSRSEIVNHTGGPIPYAQLVSMDKSGYNTKSHKHHKKSPKSSETAAANPAPSDQNASPSAPSASPSPDAAPAAPTPPPSSPNAGGSPQ
jgi:hypothetical protein